MKSTTNMFSFNCPPILFIVFNRPDLTRRVFERIRLMKPHQLFIAADGPRSDYTNDEYLCAETRLIQKQVDWPCQVTTLFRDENLGCRRAVSGAITWFFEHVDEGIILEDDCLPDSTFFRYCAELLERFRHDRRIFIISGCNELGKCSGSQYSYFYTLGTVWGWATWKRAWQHYDGDLALWNDEAIQQRLLLYQQKAPFFVEEIINGCISVKQGNLDTWDYQWVFSIISQDGLGITPTLNMISNIGFREDATHTTCENQPHAKVSVQPIDFPLIHNPNCTINSNYYVERNKMLISKVKKPLLLRAKFLIRKILRFVYHLNRA